MIERIIRASSARPLLTAILRARGSARRRARLSRAAQRRVPRPLHARVQRDRAEPGDGRRGARDHDRDPARERARRPAGHAAHALEQPARRRAGHGRVRARRRLLPLAPAASPSACSSSPRALPAGSEPPLLSSLTGRLNEIMELTLDAERRQRGSHDPARPRRVRAAEPPARGAGRGRGRAARRLPAPAAGADRSRAHGRARRDARQVLHALEGVNAERGRRLHHARADGVERASRSAAPSGAEDVAQVVVAMAGSTPVLVSRRRRRARSGRRAARHRAPPRRRDRQLRVAKQFGADTVQVAAGVRAALAEIERGLPQGVHVRIAYDQAELVRTALGGRGPRGAARRAARGRGAVRAAGRSARRVPGDADPAAVARDRRAAARARRASGSTR